MDITHNLIINASAETIYNAMATEAGIKGWWCTKSEVGENIGENSVLKFDKDRGLVSMQFNTAELIPHSRVRWNDVSNDNPAWHGTSLLTEINPVDGACEVTFSHIGFDDKWKGQEPYEMTNQGWQHFVNSLKSYCETGSGSPF